MAFEKGKEKTGGRKAGVSNKATQEAREAIALFVNGNVNRLQNWLDRIADDRELKDGTTIAGKPEKAFELFNSVLEYHIPKLARTENKTDFDGKMTISWED